MGRWISRRTRSGRRCRGMNGFWMLGTLMNADKRWPEIGCGKVNIVSGYAGIEAGISASNKAGVENWLCWRLCQHSNAQEGPGATFRGRQVLSDMQVKTGY